jgi:L-ribulokinase
MIIETFEENGVPVNGVLRCRRHSREECVCHADICRCDQKGDQRSPGHHRLRHWVRQCSVPWLQGRQTGGFDTIMDAARVMAKVKEQTYRPIGENTAIYDRLFAEYRILHDYFGRGANDVMKRLKAIRKEVKG